MICISCNNQNSYHAKFCKFCGERISTQDAGKNDSRKEEFGNKADTSDPYVVLDLHPGCSIEEIKFRYRKLAHIYHPDKNLSQSASDKKRFLQIQRAYQSLKQQRNFV